MKKLISIISFLFIGFACVAAPMKSMLGANGTEMSKGDEFINPYITDGLVAMWDGEWNVSLGVHDDNASVWKDIIGGVELTLHGGSCWTSNGLSLDGTSGYVEADTPLGKWSGIKTLDCSLHFNSQPSRCCVIRLGCEDGNLSINLEGYRLTGYSNPYYRHVGEATIVPTLNHIARTKANTATPWYVDGKATVSDNTNWSAASGSAKTIFGARENYNDRFFNGVIRCVRVYSRPLSAEEIKHNYLIDKERFGL